MLYNTFIRPEISLYWIIYEFCKTLQTVITFFFQTWQSSFKMLPQCFWIVSKSLGWSRLDCFFRSCKLNVTPARIMAHFYQQVMYIFYFVKKKILIYVCINSIYIYICIYIYIYIRFRRKKRFYQLINLKFLMLPFVFLFFSSTQTENCTPGPGMQREYKFSANLGIYDINV